MTRARYVLRGATIVTGTGDGGLADHAVVVEDDRIAWIGPSAGVPRPQDAVVIEVGGRCLLPGLIDAHVHLCNDGAPDFFAQVRGDSVSVATIRSIVNLTTTLKAGITTVRDCGSANAVAVDVARAVETGMIAGPRILAAGRVITMTGGHGHFIGTEADGPDQVRAAVRAELKLGAHVIKLIATGGVLTPGVEPGQTTLAPDELSTAVREAHNAGRRVACHAIGAEGICNALRAGVDTIEHGNYIDERGIELALEHEAFLIPTFVAPRAALGPATDGGRGDFARKAKELIAVHQENFAKAYAAGVRVAAGTDAGTPFNPHGDLVRELALMVEYCMSPMEAIRCATLSAAEALGVERELGSVEVGKVADLIVSDGDPLSRIEDLRRPRLVMQAGRIHLDTLSRPASSAVQPTPAPA